MNLKNQPLVSVVTPVYNGEKYLAECIESILAQTYENWEYIIVNNCSKDRTAEIAQHYAQKDARIRLHNNQEFLDIIPNWNNALRQISADSKYCKVIHADDWLFPECIAKMVEVAEAHPTVSMVGSYRLCGTKVDLDGLPYPSTLIPGREICRTLLLTDSDPFGSPTSLLLRSDLIRTRATFYNEDNFHADTEVGCDILQDTDFGFVHQVLTYTRMHEQSMTSSFTYRFRSNLSSHLQILKKYGPIYLNNKEYQKRLQELLYEYYRHLGESVFDRKDKKFWSYHTSNLAKLGEPLNRLKLLKASSLYVLDHLLNPKRTIQSNLQEWPGKNWPGKTTTKLFLVVFGLLLLWFSGQYKISKR